MARNIEVVTFDCYGTLIDAAGGLGTFLYSLARGCGEEYPPPGFVLVARFAEAQADALHDQVEGFDAVLDTALRTVATERRWRLEAGDVEWLVQAMGSWQPFAESRLALRYVQGYGLRSGLVANCSRRIMAHTLHQLDIGFDAVVLSEDCGAYKPAPSVFEALFDKLDADPHRVLHVSGSFESDIPVAQELGCMTAWINRGGKEDPGEPAPTYEWQSLRGLIELAALSQRD